jgi:hypothetical protein
LVRLTSDISHSCGAGGVVALCRRVDDLPPPSLYTQRVYDLSAIIVAPNVMAPQFDRRSAPCHPFPGSSSLTALC